MQYFCVVMLLSIKFFDAELIEGVAWILKLAIMIVTY